MDELNGRNRNPNLALLAGVDANPILIDGLELATESYACATTAARPSGIAPEFNFAGCI